MSWWPEHLTRRHVLPLARILAHPLSEEEIAALAAESPVAPRKMPARQNRSEWWAERWPWRKAR
jgi:hypothetical protein